MYRTVPVPKGIGTVRYQGPKLPYRTDTDTEKKNKFGIGMASIPDHTVPVPALELHALVRLFDTKVCDIPEEGTLAFTSAMGTDEPVVSTISAISGFGCALG